MLSVAKGCLRPKGAPLTSECVNVRNKVRYTEYHFVQWVQEWTEQNSLKTTLRKFEVIWSV